jgi:hypothetical protein
MSLSAREPLALRAAIVAAVTAVVHVAVVLGLLQLDAASEAAVGGAIDLVGTAVLVVWTRGAVTPNAAVDEKVEAAVAEAVEDGPKHRAA